MKYLITLLTLLFTSTFCIAQTSIFPDVSYTNLSLIDVSGENIFAIGTCELGMFSKDGGESWEYIDIPEGYLRDMKILSTGQGDLALFMTDEALWAWDFVSEELAAIDISDIDQFGDLIALEILGDKIYLISVGRIHSASAPDFTWEMLTDVLYDGDYFITTTTISNTAVYLGSSEGQLFEAVLTGGSYEEIYNFDNRVRALAMFDFGTGYATIQSASGPMKTTDEGDSWAVLNSFPENAKMYAYDANTVLTVNTNRFYVSTDGGIETTYVPTSDDPNVSLINHASFSEDGDLYFCGRSSTILKSTNAGLSYSNLNEYNRSDLRQITFDNAGRAVASGSQALFYSEDDGENWSSFNTTQLMGDPTYVNSAAILPDNTYIIGHGDGHALIKDGALISDGGINLQTLFSDSDGLLLGVTEIGGNRAITKSTDNGITWENKFFTDAYINKFRSTASGKIYCPDEDRYLISEDGGEDWEEIDLPVTGFIKDLAILDDGTSLFSIGGELYESDNAGETLTEVASAYIIDNIHFIAPDHYIYTQISSGNTSLREKHPNESNIKTIASFCGEAVSSYLKGNVLWLGLKGGHIITYEFEEDMPDAIHDLSVQPVFISPNPVSLGATMHFSTSASKTHLQIFNTLGERILDRQGFAESALMIDAQYFVPGIYILRQEVDGEVFQSKFLVAE